MSPTLLIPLLLALAAAPDSAAAPDTADTAAQLSRQQLAARDCSFMGVTLGIDQQALRRAVRSARRMSPAEALATGRFVDTDNGAERWSATSGLEGAANATFDSLDSALYAVSWVRTGDRNAFESVRDSLVGRLGTYRTQNGDTYTWVFLGVERRVESDYQPMVGIRIGVVDEAAVKRLRDRQAER